MASRPFPLVGLVVKAVTVRMTRRRKKKMRRMRKMMRKMRRRVVMERMRMEVKKK